MSGWDNITAFNKIIAVYFFGFLFGYLCLMSKAPRPLSKLENYGTILITVSGHLIFYTPDFWHYLLKGSEPNQILVLIHAALLPLAFSFGIIRILISYISNRKEIKLL